jgi:hypothetical protein
LRNVALVALFTGTNPLPLQKSMTSIDGYKRMYKEKLGATFTNTTMKNLLYLLAFIAIVGWLIGFIGFESGGLIHLLLIVALALLLIGLFNKTK